MVRPFDVLRILVAFMSVLRRMLLSQGSREDLVRAVDRYRSQVSVMMAHTDCSCVYGSQGFPSRRVGRYRRRVSRGRFVGRRPVVSRGSSVDPRPAIVRRARDFVRRSASVVRPPRPTRPGPDGRSSLSRPVPDVVRPVPVRRGGMFGSSPSHPLVTDAAYSVPSALMFSRLPSGSVVRSLAVPLVEPCRPGQCGDSCQIRLAEAEGRLLYYVIPPAGQTPPAEEAPAVPAAVVPPRPMTPPPPYRSVVSTPVSSSPRGQRTSQIVEPSVDAARNVGTDRTAAPETSSVLQARLAEIRRHFVGANLAAGDVSRIPVPSGPSSSVSAPSSFVPIGAGLAPVVGQDGALEDVAEDVVGSNLGRDRRIVPSIRISRCTLPGSGGYVAKRAKRSRSP